MNNKTEIINFLVSILGEYDVYKDHEYMFHCPVCNHRKHKLCINIDNFNWHCWVCEPQGTRGKNLFQLLKKINAPTDKYGELKSILGVVKEKVDLSDFDKLCKSIQKNELLQTNNEKSIQIVSLPYEYIPLWEINNTIGYKRAMYYLKNRNVSLQDIMKYQIGYCDTGKYRDRIVIPSFDMNGKLNYFITRTYNPNVKAHYLNSPTPKKDRVIFELQINYNLPIVIVEGAFDAIAVKRNAVPNLGVTLSNKLIENIIIHQTPDIYLCLDNDAKRQALMSCKKLFKNNINVHWVQLNQKDPSLIGFNEMQKIIKNNSMKIDFKNLLLLQI